MARERAVGRGAPGSDERLSLAALGEDTGGFIEALRRRPLSGVGFVEPEAADLCLVARHADASASPAVERTRRATVQLATSPGPHAPLALCAPTATTGGRLVELAVAPDAEPALAARLARALQRWGFEVARTAPGPDFVSHRLLLAFLEPLLRHLQRHADVRPLNTTLRHAGFVRRPHALVAAVGGAPMLTAALARRLDTEPSTAEALLETLGADAFDDGAGDPRVLDALAVSLLHAVLAVRASGQAREPSIIDLIARELLDFPLPLRSLCAWLRRARIAAALDHGAALAAFVPDAALETARLFVAEGREFYRGAGSAAA